MVATTDQKARFLDLVTGLMEMVRDGNRDIGAVSDVLQNIKERRDFADRLLGAETFNVIVDYTQSLADMIAAGNYSWVNSDITQEHFLVSGQGKAEKELVLVHLNRNVSTEEALKEIDRLGFKPETIESLLAFGAKYLNKQREFPIVALGAVWVRPDGRRIVAYLHGDASKRSLCLHWCDYDWDGYCRFLAARK